MFLGTTAFFIVFWLLFAAAFSLFAYRGYQLFSWARLGTYENRFDHLGKRLMTVVGQVFPQTCSLKSVSRKDIAGIGHALIFWGFLAFLLHYLIYIFIGDGLGLSEVIRKTAFSQYFSLIVDIAGVFVALAIIWAAIRRYVLRPERLEPTPEAAIILALIFSLMLAHFSMEGFHIGATKDPLAVWTPLGLVFANFFTGLGLEPSLQAVLYEVAWWIHYLIIIGFLVFILYSKHLHIMVAPINIFFSSLRPKGALVPIDLEKAESYGVSRIEQFTWKQLLDLYACTQCGRCQANCPAYLTGKPLNPKQVILDLKEYLLEEGSTLLKAKAAAVADPPSRALVGEVVTEDVLWSCTTCRACQEQCPALIEHIDKIVDMRRNLVLEQAKIPETAETILRCIEARGHTCRGTTVTRTDWTTGLNVNLLSEDSQVDLVYWVGCTAALEDRNIKVAVAVAKILQTAGINFGILGPEETCCGEPSRRMGNEYLFQLQAQKNIELLKGYKVRKLVTTCPHCFNTIKKEYPQFGGEFEVVHHSQLIVQLIKEGRLKPAIWLSEKITYHDSCYLGRYNDIYESPRQIVKAISKVKPLEMGRNRRTGFCCGGGGGRFWMEERIGKRISQERTEEVIKTGAQVVATACPYCLQMFEDAIKAKEAQESLKALDIAELVAKATIGSGTT